MSASQRARFLERCYDTTASIDEWVDGVTTTLAPLIADRDGLMINGGRSNRVPELASAVGPAERLLYFQREAHEAAPHDYLKRAYRPFLVKLLSEQFGGEQELWRETSTRSIFQFFEFGIVDAIGLMLREEHYRIVVSVPLRRRHGRSSREPQLRQMRRHLQSGFMAALRHAPQRDDIVLDPIGRVLHAGQPLEGVEARGLLRAAAKAHATERRGAATDPDAERIWRELWEGGWALVESIDTDGKRMLLLRRDPSNARARRLDPYERFALASLARGDAYKVIASELGVALSTASAIVGRGLRKLGFKSRTDFIGRVGKGR
jgi:DNA-binding CsgD family transcriptional regulator